MNIILVKNVISVLVVILVLSYVPKSVLAQEDSPSVLYVPLIGITSVPSPLALPGGAGDVIYNYAVKNFIEEVDLTDIQVVDDKCDSVKFVEGDDDGDSKLDYIETWRYTCTTRISVTTQSIATATGTANNITATHRAYATVVVGSDTPPPLISIINITKVAYPLSLPAGGGEITFTYKVNNPGEVPLSDVKVVDDKCSSMSSKLGDTNGNNLLDINEVWIYTCVTYLNQTTTNTVNVSASANNFTAVGSATITVHVESTSPDFPAQSIPSLPETGVHPNLKIIVWSVLAGILAGLIMFLILTSKINFANILKHINIFDRNKKQ